MGGFEKLKEPFIVCMDDREGGFEMIFWAKTEEEALNKYESWEGEYPDRGMRNKHIFKMIRTTGQDMQDSRGGN